VDSRYRNIPAIHRLLDLPALRAAADRYGHAAVIDACRTPVDRLRQRVADDDIPGETLADPNEALEREILEALRHTGEPA